MLINLDKFTSLEPIYGYPVINLKVNLDYDINYRTGHRLTALTNLNKDYIIRLIRGAHNCDEIYFVAEQLINLNNYGKHRRNF